MGFLEVQRQCGVSHTVPLGAQGPSRVVPGKSGLHARGEVERDIALETWQPTPVFLLGESQGQGSLVGCHLWGHTESDTTEALELWRDS